MLVTQERTSHLQVSCSEVAIGSVSTAYLYLRILKGLSVPDTAFKFPTTQEKSKVSIQLGAKMMELIANVAFFFFFLVRQPFKNEKVLSKSFRAMRTKTTTNWL